MPQNTFFLGTRDLLVSQKMTRRHFFPTLHPVSTVIFAPATVLAFVLLRNSRFNVHCYAQREATLRNRPGSALRPLATSCAKDYKAHSLLQTSFVDSPRILMRKITQDRPPPTPPPPSPSKPGVAEDGRTVCETHGVTLEVGETKVTDDCFRCTCYLSGYNCCG